MKIGGQIDEHFDWLKQGVDALDAMQVYITGYPTGLFDELVIRDGQCTVGSRSCGAFHHGDWLTIEADDAKFIKDSGTRLNHLIELKASEFGKEKDNWHYIDTALDFVGRRYCAADTLWVQATDSCEHQGDYDGTMHPNAQGHALRAIRLADALRKYTIKPARGPQPGQTHPGQPQEQQPSRLRGETNACTPTYGPPGDRLIMPRSLSMPGTRLLRAKGLTSCVVDDVPVAASPGTANGLVRLALST